MTVPLFCLALASRIAAQTPADLQRQAFELAYNLDHEAAEARLREALALAPDVGSTHRAVATITWLNILFRRGALTVDHYLGGMARPRIDVPRPPPELDRTFRSHLERALALSRTWTQREPKNPQAWYDLGATLGLQASYTASIEGRLRAGFRAARSAFDAHERVLRFDPRRHDAGLIPGTYRYVVATLSLPMRWMAYAAGFGGGRERGLRLIEQAAAYPGDSRVEARFALILIYNRERRYDDALRIIDELRAQFPRNRLLGLEHGATMLRAGRAAEAEATLTSGIQQLAADRRARAGGEVALWHYKRGAARVRLKRLDEAAADLRTALAADPPRWVRGRVMLEEGKIADLRGDRPRAQAEYRQAITLCESDRDPQCAREARELARRSFRSRQ